jgi:putative membrane protein insertion efficiency factor
MISKLFIFIIKIYQRYISPLTPPSCRFYPSCSEYACEALKLHGPLKGTLLATYRVIRCNPFNPGGYDPVPLPRNIRRETD